MLYILWSYSKSHVSMLTINQVMVQLLEFPSHSFAAASYTIYSTYKTHLVTTTQRTRWPLACGRPDLSRILWVVLMNLGGSLSLTWQLSHPCYWPVTTPS